MNKNLVSAWKRRRRHQQLWRVRPHSCHYCGCPLTVATATIDHLRPRHCFAPGDPARDAIDNLVLACRPCNQDKGAGEATTKANAPTLADVWPEAPLVGTVVGAPPPPVSPHEGIFPDYPNPRQRKLLRLFGGKEEAARHFQQALQGQCQRCGWTPLPGQTYLFLCRQQDAAGCPSEAVMQPASVLFVCQACVVRKHLHEEGLALLASLAGGQCPREARAVSEWSRMPVRCVCASGGGRNDG